MALSQETVFIILCGVVALAIVFVLKIGSDYAPKNKPRKRCGVCGATFVTPLGSSIMLEHQKIHPLAKVVWEILPPEYTWYNRVKNICEILLECPHNPTHTNLGQMIFDNEETKQRFDRTIL